MLTWIVTSKLGRTVGAAVGAIVAFVLFIAKVKADTRKDTIQDMKEVDQANADEIRAAVRKSRADGVSVSERLYRD